MLAYHPSMWKTFDSRKDEHLQLSFNVETNVETSDSRKDEQLELSFNVETSDTRKMNNFNHPSMWRPPIADTLNTLECDDCR